MIIGDSKQQKLEYHRFWKGLEWKYIKIIRDSGDVVFLTSYSYQLFWWNIHIWDDGIYCNTKMISIVATILMFSYVYQSIIFDVYQNVEIMERWWDVL